MEDNLINGEQPKESQVHTVATDDEKGTLLTSEGSPLGKFKSADTLLDAYNELQSEFTRKCQKLSDAEKKLQEINATGTSTNSKEISDEFVWGEKIGEFLQSHEKASGLMEDITNEIANDDTLRNDDNGLEKAYSRVIEKKYIPEENLANNEEFLNKYIYSNSQIKNKIIKEYVDSLQDSRNPINVINSGFSRGASSINKFNSLDDAREYVENMFWF